MHNKKNNYQENTWYVPMTYEQWSYIAIVATNPAALYAYKLYTSLECDCKQYKIGKSLNTFHSENYSNRFCIKLYFIKKHTVYTANTISRYNIL